MVGHLGIEFTQITDDSLIAKMPVDERTKQPFGILHGGASAALAETVGSVAGNMVIDNEKYIAVGVEISTSHLKMVRSGFVTAEAKPIKLGKKLHTWEIKASNDKGDLVSYSKLTLMVLEKDKQK